MKFRGYLFVTLFSALLIVSFQTITAQSIFPMDSTENMVIYRGKKDLDPVGKKKSMAIIKAWAGERMVFPPMVFSVIHESKERIILKALTEVPSQKGINPISFKLDIAVSRKSFDFRADNFYFEDITLSLEEWLKKYESSDSERHIKMVNLIGKGLGSHIYLALEDLKNQINKK